MTLALTFDDGPDPRGTPAVLDALEAAVSQNVYLAGDSSFLIVNERLVSQVPAKSFTNKSSLGAADPGSVF